MAISYPLALPATDGLVRVTFRDRVATGFSESPFSFAGQSYEHQGDGWGAVLEFAEMERADAEAWIAWRLALAGRLGSFLMGDHVHTTPRGSWSGGTPVVSGVHAAGVKTVNIRGVDGLSGSPGDWFQLGGGSTSYLHKVTQSFTQAGSPSLVAVEIWPRTRAALADGDALTISSPKGRWRLAVNGSEWTLDPDSGYKLPPLEVVEYR